MINIEEMTAFLKDLFDLMQKLEELVRWGKDIVNLEIGRTTCKANEYKEDPKVLII